MIDRTLRAFCAGLLMAGLAAVLLPSTPRAAEPVPLSPNMTCRETWPGLTKCRDKKSGKVVQTCRLNNLSKRWDCKRP